MTDQALDDLARRVLLDAARQEYGSLMEELLEHQFSPAFERRMKKLVRRADHPVGYWTARTAACLLLAGVLLAGSVLALVPEARAALAGWVRDVYESWFEYRNVGENRPVSENTVYYPAWVPEGYKETAAPQAGTYVRAQYENSDRELLTVSYLKGTETVYGSSALNVEWEGAEVRPVQVGRLSADLYLNPEEGPNILVWTDEIKDAVFWIVAPLEEAELVRVAESVRESEPMPRRYCVSALPWGGYGLGSVVEEPGWGETVYENMSGNYSITFGYSADREDAPQPETEGYPVSVGEREGQIYPAAKDGGGKTLIWTTESGDILWVVCPLPDEDMIWIGENVIVKLNRFSDLMELPVADTEVPLLYLVEQALTEEFVAQVEDCARRDAQTRNRMSEEYRQLADGQEARYISPDREDAIARVSVLADELAAKGVRGETITSLFGPFYTASIYVGWDDTTTHICDERGVMIASRNTRNNPDWVLCPTAEEMQFTYIVNQIYSKAYSEARARLNGNE